MVETKICKASQDYSKLLLTFPLLKIKIGILGTTVPKSGRIMKTKSNKTDSFIMLLISFCLFYSSL